MDPESGRNGRALSVSEFGAELFESIGLPVDGNPNVFTETELERYLRSSRGGRIPSELLRGTEQSRDQLIAQDVISELDELLLAEQRSGMAEQPIKRVNILSLRRGLAGQQPIADRIEDFDIAVAAHAVALQATLVTDDVNHMSRIKGLRIENWRRE